MGGESFGDEKIVVENILVDTSVWIDFFRNRQNSETRLFVKIVEEGKVFFTCPVIIQEILQGIRNDSEYLLVKEKLLALDILEIDPVSAAIGAADLYRKLRKRGVTIKKTNDCLIAFYALHFRVPLLHHDADFELITAQTNLKTVSS